MASETLAHQVGETITATLNNTMDLFQNLDITFILGILAAIILTDLINHNIFPKVKERVLWKYLSINYGLRYIFYGVYTFIIMFVLMYCFEIFFNLLNLL